MLITSQILHMRNLLLLPLSLLVVLGLSSCGGGSKPATPEDIVKMFLEAKDGDVIEIPEGEFKFDKTLTLKGVNNVTVKGAGMDKTILSFKGQTQGAQGIEIQGDGCTVQDLTVQDTKGDGIKFIKSKDVVIRNIKAEWTNGPDTANGGYGLYPVECDRILIEGCHTSDASDAGIYLGQSDNGTIRNNKCFENVQGIVVENSHNISIHDNECYGNTLGIGVMDLPELPVKAGSNLVIYNNNIHDNDHPNFGNPTATVGIVPAGTGIFLMACKNAEVFGNTIKNHKTAPLSIISYEFTQRPYKKEPGYSPFNSGVSVYDNKIIQPEVGELPDTTLPIGKLIAGIFKTDVPAVMFDGFVNPEGLEKHPVCFGDNGDVQIVNIDAPNEFKSPAPISEQLQCELPKQKGNTSTPSQEKAS